MEPVNIIKILFDLCSVVLLFAVAQGIKFIAKPFKSGFYCDDYSVNHPFKSSTVSNVNLVLIAVIFPLTLLTVTEFARLAYARLDSGSSKRSVYKVRFGQSVRDVPEHLGNIYINCGCFMFGLVATSILTDLGKVVIGRLRPNFLSVCSPDKNPYLDVCQPGKKYFVQPELDFACTSGDASGIEDARMSFPSGHASISFYGMVFLILFIKYSWNCRTLGLIPRLVQVAFLVTAAFVALSRVVDNKHHPSDVLAGTILGILVACISFYHLTDYFRLRGGRQNPTKHDYGPANQPTDEESCSLFLNPTTSGQGERVFSGSSSFKSQSQFSPSVQPVSTEII